MKLWSKIPWLSLYVSEIWIWEMVPKNLSSEEPCVLFQAAPSSHQVDRQQAADRKGEPSLMVEMNYKLFSHLMAGVECVSGKTVHFYFQDLWTRVNQKYISKVFCSGDAECWAQLGAWRERAIRWQDRLYFCDKKKTCYTVHFVV